VDRERVAAMLAALVNLSERAARENGKEYASQVRVDTEGGHLLMVRLEGGGALAATTGAEARVGLVLYDMRNSRGEVEKVLQEGSRR
jgi:predicted regulator of Ras-like GTPase activity (Roadblock/LC7/MglB family)